MSIAPESIRSMSRMSLISRTSRSLFSSAIRSIRSAFSGESSSTPPASRPSAPRIDVSGVRSSWLTTEMNSSLTRSASRCSVTSWPVPSTLSTAPSAPVITSARTCRTRTSSTPCVTGSRRVCVRASTQT